MSNISRRINKVEKTLKLNESPMAITVVQYGGDLPPDRTEGSITNHFVKYDRQE